MSDLIALINKQITDQNDEQDQCFLARVIRVNNARLTVDVEMLTLRYDADGETQDDVPVLGVPLVCHQALRQQSRSLCKSGIPSSVLFHKHPSTTTRLPLVMPMCQPE